MKKKSILCIVLILLLVLVGCTDDTDNSTEETKTTEATTTPIDDVPVDIIYDDDHPPIDELSCLEDKEAPQFKQSYCTFTLSILPDTQIYTRNERIAEVYYNQTKWIASNYNRYNIKFTAHLGDI